MKKKFNEIIFLFNIMYNWGWTMQDKFKSKPVLGFNKFLKLALNPLIFIPNLFHYEWDKTYTWKNIFHCHSYLLLAFP